jgi:hypothetical protein
MFIKVIVYDCSLLFTSCSNYLPSSPHNILCWDATSQVLKLSREIMQTKKGNYLAWFFKEIAHNLSTVIRAYLDEHVINYSALEEKCIGFEYYRLFPHDANKDKELVTTTFIIIPLFFVLGDNSHSIFDVDHPKSILLTWVQILAFDIDVLGLIFPLSEHWIPKEQSKFGTKHLVNFIGQTTAITLK